MSNYDTNNDDDDDDDESIVSDDDTNSSEILLGFAQPPQTKEALQRHNFPSKAGGKPAWLNPRDLPACESLRCGCCDKPLAFLLQIYAPKDNIDTAFHRMIYVFCCEDGACDGAQNSVKILRSQLRRTNSFYPSFSNKFEQDEQYQNEDNFRVKKDTFFENVSLCVVCGVRADKSCASCRRAFYCSRLHQRRHWKAQHSSECAQNAVTKSNVAKSKELRFPQFEIIIDEEPEDKATKFVAENTLLKKYESEVVNLDERDQQDHDELSFQNRVKIDDVFVMFQARIAREPAQCLRYQQNTNANVLWTHTQNCMPTALRESLRCHSCAGPLQFEFQVLPQLLSFLRVDQHVSRRQKSMDFGTIVVYTCRDSCGDGEHDYFEEQSWRQPSFAPM